MTFKFVPYEHDFLDVTCKPLLLYLVPLLFLRIGTILIEEHPAYSDEQKDVYPGYIE